MYKGFDYSGFMEWLKNTFDINCYAKETVLNIIEYAHKHEQISKDQFAIFVSDMLPGVGFLDVARFCEVGCLTDETLRLLGRI